MGYAVIFTSRLTGVDPEKYGEMAAELEQRLAEMSGFQGMVHARSEVGITVCYWDSLESIENWKRDEKHRAAQEKGKSTWYAEYEVKVCKIEYEYGFNK